MVTILSRKYAKALCELQNIEKLSSTLQSLNRLSIAAKNAKFKDIMAAKEVGAQEKISLLCDISQNDDAQFKNFIALLQEKKRVELIPDITEEIRKYIAMSIGVHEAKVVANFHISDSQIRAIEQAICTRLSKKITLEFDQVAKETFNGIKVEIDDLGVEVEIDKGKIKNSLVGHILSSSKI